jgi:hypothetical protein
MPGDRVICRATAESRLAGQTGATEISQDVSLAFIDDIFLGRDDAQRRNYSRVNHQVCIFDCIVTHRPGSDDTEATVTELWMGPHGPTDPKQFLGYSTK